MAPWQPTLIAADAGGLRLWTEPEGGAVGASVVFTDRTGGVSSPPYHRLNLAARVGDRHEDVAENRRRVAAAAGFDLRRLVLSRQVHGTTARRVGADDSGVVGEADVLVTDTPGTALAILTADCAAVVIRGAGGLAVVHAGWRGLAAGAVEAGVRAVAPARAAWVGPAIRACCYEVGTEVVDAFRRRGLPVTDHRHVDVSGAARAALAAAGVPLVAAVDDCTACLDRYFSYRRDGVTGRQGAFALLTAAP